MGLNSPLLGPPLRCSTVPVPRTGAPRPPEPRRRPNANHSGKALTADHTQQPSPEEDV